LHFFLSLSSVSFSWQADQGEGRRSARDLSLDVKGSSKLFSACPIHLASREEGEPEATLPEPFFLSSASTTHATTEP
jgi:hypothetical protein